MLTSQLQQRIARQIFIGYLSLISLTLILYLFSGMLSDELTSLLTTLSAISALYVAPLFKFFSQSLQSQPEASSLITQVDDGLSVKLMKLVIPCHFILVSLLIVTKSLNMLTFKDMNIFLGFIETTFGTYMGFVLIALFKVEKV